MPDCHPVVWDGVIAFYRGFKILNEKKDELIRFPGRLRSLALEHESADNCSNSTDNTEYTEDKRQQ
jgi:hypothetical protein